MQSIKLWQAGELSIDYFCFFGKRLTFLLVSAIKRVLFALLIFYNEWLISKTREGTKMRVRVIRRRVVEDGRQIGEHVSASMRLNVCVTKQCTLTAMSRLTVVKDFRRAGISFGVEIKPKGKLILWRESLPNDLPASSKDCFNHGLRCIIVEQQQLCRRTMVVIRSGRGRVLVNPEFPDCSAKVARALF